MAPVLAHAGHWATQLIYLAPIALVALAVLWSKRADRRAGRDRDEEDAASAPTLDEVLDGRGAPER